MRDSIYYRRNGTTHRQRLYIKLLEQDEVLSAKYASLHEVQAEHRIFA